MQLYREEGGAANRIGRIFLSNCFSGKNELVPLLQIFTDQPPKTDPTNVELDEAIMLYIIWGCIISYSLLLVESGVY